MDNTPIRVVSMFCGIGGFDLGLKNASPKYKIVWSNDNDRYAYQIYRKRFSTKPDEPQGEELCARGNGNRVEPTIREQPNISDSRWHESSKLYEGDIRTIDPLTIPEHDLLCAGFPCQSFSIAGKRRGIEDARGTLFFEICRIARAKRTPYLFLENVKGLLSASYVETYEAVEAETRPVVGYDKWGNKWLTERYTGRWTMVQKTRTIPGTRGWVFATILQALDELGYVVQWDIYNSKALLPQNRERVFIIGHLRGQPRPKVFPIGETNQVYPESSQELREQVSNTLRTNYGKASANETYVQEISTALDANYGKGWLDHGQRTMIFKRGVMGERNQRWLEDGKEYSRNFPQGQRVYDPAGISAQLNAQGEGWGAKTGLYEIAPSITTEMAHGTGFNQTPKVVQAIGQIRRLTPIECARLQGFPDDWCKWGLTIDGEVVEISDTQQYKCYGNAVTTKVIEAIGRQLLNG